MTKDDDASGRDAPGDSGIVAWSDITSVEGIPLLGGYAQARVRLRGESGVLLEITCPAGVGSPVHSHDHDSYIYLLGGHLTGTLDGAPAELEPGETLLHPSGARHSVLAITDSHWLEFKSPPPIAGPW